MYHVQEIMPQIFWVGENDWKLERFENIHPLPNGITYNSYLVLDTNTLLFDTVYGFANDQFIENITFLLNGRTLDYLIINHMEPDHSMRIEEIVRLYPEVKVVGNARTFQYYEQFYPLDISANYLEVSEGEELSTGQYNFRFIMAPMVHWPEVMFTYETSQGILFSADAFGSFGVITGNLFYDQAEYIPDETRRYYANIIGRFGMPVQSVLTKLSGLTVQMICPLHGLIWRSENVGYILSLYDLWSRYEPEDTGIVIVFASMYGNTQLAAELLANKLSLLGVLNIRMYDVSKTHSSFIISDLWRFSHAVFAAPTYNMHLFPLMDYLLRDLTMLGFKNRKIALIGNHTWLDASINAMETLLNAGVNYMVISNPILIKSSLKPEQEGELNAMATAIFHSMTEASDVES